MATVLSHSAIVNSRRLDLGQSPLQAVKDMIEAGQVTPVSERSYPLAEAADAIRHIEQGRARGKVVLTI